MAARQHSRFVHFVLPWLVAAVGGAVYLLTLHRWTSFGSLDVISKVSGWDWNTMQLGPVTLLVTWPARWLPAPWQPLALNVLAAVLGGLGLGLLAKCVALLPHDRTRDQRQRERSDFAFLSLPLAWVPPVAAAGLLGFQQTFWESATAMTGDIIDLALFAFCVFCFLRFRVIQEDRYLAWLSFAFGAAAANNWGIIGFCPLFFFAIVWAKGIAFFDARFLIRTALAGLAGTLVYLVQPIALKVSGQADGSLLELLRTQLGFQRQFLFAFPRVNLGFCSIASVLPMIFIGIRWPSTFGDMSAAGAALTNFLFRLIHVAFLVFCAWTLFDPPFSPRHLGLGMPFLHFYFLTALFVGYGIGYLMLVFGQAPERKMKRASDGMVAMGRLVAGLVATGSLAAAAGLAAYNLPAIRGQNGPLVRELASTLLPPAGVDSVVASEDNALLMLVMGLVREKGRDGEVIPLSTPVLRRHVYQRHHEARYGKQWPALAVERLTDPLGDDVLLQQVFVLGLTRQLFYLHPSFGYYFEAFHLVPTNAFFTFQRQDTNQFRPAPLPDDQFQALNRHWTAVRQQLVDNPVIARLRQQRALDAARVGAHYSRALNAWGVTLQQRGRLEEAGQFFAAAQELNPDNVAAIINARFNENLRDDRHEAVILEKELNDQLGQYRDIPSFLLICGPVDEPGFCFRLGRIFHDGNLNRQAAAQFARALDLQPGVTETRLWLASALLNAGFFPHVLRQVADIRSQTPDLTPSQSNDLLSMESWAHFRSGDLPAAERLLKKAQQEFPDRLEPLQTLNDIYVAANQTNAALAVIDQLIHRMPGDPRPIITKSAIQMQAGALADAVETLSGVLEKEPGFFPALVNRALALSQLGRLDEAERDYRKLMEIAPQLNLVYYHLGEIDYQRRNAAGARQNYRRFLEMAVPGSPEARTAQQRLDDIAAGKLGG